MLLGRYFVPTPEIIYKYLYCSMIFACHKIGWKNIASRQWIRSDAEYYTALGSVRLWSRIVESDLNDICLTEETEVVPFSFMTLCVTLITD